MPIDEQQLKLSARLAAIEYMIGHLFRMQYQQIGATREQIERAHNELRQHLQTMPMPSDDPAINDLVAAEMQDAFEALLARIASLAAQAGNPE